MCFHDFELVVYLRVAFWMISSKILFLRLYNSSNEDTKLMATKSCQHLLPPPPPQLSNH